MNSPSPHIVVDGRELAGKPTGVGRYVTGILREWAAAAPRPRITVIVPGAVPEELTALAPAIGIEEIAASSTGTWFEQTRLAGHARRLGADVFFAPAYTAPLNLRCPFVVVVHDVSFFARPEWFGWREGLRRRVLTKAAARRASTVVTVSEFSAGEIVRYLGVPRERIVVAGSGAPAVPVAGPGRREPLVLYAGTLLARRHIADLIEGFALVAGTVPNAQLVLIGDDRSRPPIDPDALAARFGIGARVRWLKYASDADLRAMYARARVFAFISDYEGFAITPMEALALGAPVVLADTPVSREIYGDGAITVAPQPRAIAAALQQLLTDDRAHADMVARGQARLARFTWSRTAADVLAALERA